MVYRILLLSSTFIIVYNSSRSGLPNLQKTFRWIDNNERLLPNWRERPDSLSLPCLLVCPSKKIPSSPIGQPRPTLWLPLSICWSKRKLCRQQQTTNIFSQTRMSRYSRPLFNILQRFFNIPKVHSTSFRTASKFVEKCPSRVELSARSYGQIEVGQRR